MSQDLVTSSVAFIFHQDLLLMMGELDHCAKASPNHPRESQWDEGLDSVASPCGKIVSCFEPDESTKMCAPSGKRIH